MDQEPEPVSAYSSAICANMDAVSSKNVNNMLSVDKPYWWAGLLMLESFAGLSSEHHGGEFKPRGHTTDEIIGVSQPSRLLEQRHFYARLVCWLARRKPLTASVATACTLDVQLASFAE